MYIDVFAYWRLWISLRIKFCKEIVSWMRLTSAVVMLSKATACLLGNVNLVVLKATSAYLCFHIDLLTALMPYKISITSSTMVCTCARTRFLLKECLLRWSCFRQIFEIDVENRSRMCSIEHDFALVLFWFTIFEFRFFDFPRLKHQDIER